MPLLFDSQFLIALAIAVGVGVWSYRALFRGDYQ